MNQKLARNRPRALASLLVAIRTCVLAAFCLLLLIAGSRRASAFALNGPLEAWMGSANGFNPLPGDPILAGPHNIGDEFRRNTPIMYWACDQAFLDFFGSNGLYSVQQAFSQLNSIGSVANYSLDLSEWPTESMRHNYQAQALSLFDIKSTVMGIMTEQLGLADPVRYMWVIHNRTTIPNAPPCPDGMDYLVVQRNFDPVPSDLHTYQASDYVNGNLYSYTIFEDCKTPNPLADAVEISVDQENNIYTPVASYLSALDLGGFYLSYTRDDVGGLRYLLQTNNVNPEPLPAQSIEFVTNLAPQLVFGSNLTLFAAQALTNNAAALTALYPGLVATDFTNLFGFTTNTIITGTLVPGPPWAPAGTFQLVFTTNNVITPQLQFVHTFANVASFQLVNGQWTLVPFTMLSQVTGNQIINFQSISTVVTNPPFLPAQDFEIVTKTNNRLRVVNGPVGEFVILATNLCDLRILANIFTNVVASSNLLATGTNIVINSTGGNTNVTGTNFFNGQILSNSLSLFTYFTNHAFFVQPVICLTTNTGSSNNPTLFQGIDHVSFVRHDFDSLLGRFFAPVTNDYVMNEITNGVIVHRSVRRIVTQPDFLFTAADLAPGPAAGIPYNVGWFTIGPNPLNFNSVSAAGLPVGPGTIDSPTRITLNNGTPIYDNFTELPISFLDELTKSPIFGWGSFDGTTNPPIVYPDGASIDALIGQALLPISPGILPTGNVGVSYSVQFTSAGAQGATTVTLDASSNPLSAGLTLASDGTLSGTPSSAGTFEFTIRLADSAGHATSRLYTLIIAP